MTPMTQDPNRSAKGSVRPLGKAHSADDLAAYLLETQQYIRCEALAGAPGVTLARTYSDGLDAVIRAMFRLARDAAGFHGPAETVPVAIVATGGYGRRELCPHSDVDITFIPAKDGDGAIDRLVKEMFTLLMRVLMDEANIEVGYAYRLLEDCGHLDHQTASGLLDARLLAGSRRVFLHFEHEFWETLNPAEFIFTKLEERRRRRHGAGGTFRVVEPDIKNGPGGLRDLQTALWLLQVRDSLPAGEVRGERAWVVLARQGGIPEHRIAQLKEAKEFLFRVRNAAHSLADREADQLTTARQEELARILGYVSDDNGVPPVENFMRAMYGHLGVVEEVGKEVVDRVEHGRLVMGIGLDCVNRRLVPAGTLLASEDPAWTVWASHVAQTYGLEFGHELRQAVVDLMATSPGTAEHDQVADEFTEILRSRNPIYPSLQQMADLGILNWVLPEVGATMDLIPYDAAHDYTVGQHTLYVIRYLDELRNPSQTEEGRELHMIMAELAAPEQLYLAALLHDVGKAVPGRPHWETGVEVAERACATLRWSRDATETVAFLVRHHLLMAETSRLRDLTLPETIREFTATVTDMERLRMLYLLTYADTRAVSQGQWTQVKARFLRDLFHRASQALSGGAEVEAEEVRLNRTRRRLMRELAVENLPAEEVEAHLEGMPAHYVLNTSLDEIALHIGFARQARDGVPTVAFHDDPQATYTELTVCTQDDPRPGLLAKIAGVLFACDVTVHAAQVFTRVAGSERIALDTLWVDYRGRRLGSAKRTEVERELKAVLTGARSLSEVLTKRKTADRPAPEPTHARVLNNLSPVFTVVEVGFANPHGVLYHASRALAGLGWDIHSARLSRFRGRFMATFYVTSAKHLSDEEAAEALRKQLVSPDQ